MNELDFSGKQVLVVGASSGIGNGIAQAFRASVARLTRPAPIRRQVEPGNNHDRGQR